MKTSISEGLVKLALNMVNAVYHWKIQMSDIKSCRASVNGIKVNLKDGNAHEFSWNLVAKCIPELQ